MKLYEIRAGIREIINHNLTKYAKLTVDESNRIISAIEAPLFHYIEHDVNIRMEEELKKIKSKVFPSELDSCRHQHLPMYYASNKGINETKFKICFKCKEVIKNE